MTTRILASLAIVLTAGLSAPSAAQVVETTPCQYVTCAVRVTAGFTGERLVRGETSEEVLKINFTGSNAANFLSRVESAAAPAREFRTRRVRASVLGAIGALGAAYFVARAYQADDRDYVADPTSSDYAVLLGGFVASLWGAVEIARSNNALSRAVWEFNRAPLP